MTIDRRDFLRRSGLMAAGLALPTAWLSGCGDADGPDAIPFSVSPDRPWWLQNNFEPVSDELDVFDLEVEGRLPPELDGLYVRNGSNPQDSDNGHWFLGDGMLHGIRLQAGRALWYRNRWVRTPFFEANTGFSGAPIRGNNQANVSVIVHADRLLTSGEVGAPFQIDPSDLSTIGVHDFGGNLNTSFTAHSKIDPQTGYLHFFGYFFGVPFLTYHVVDETGRHILRQDIDVDAGTMMHSFAITDRDVVFWELPVLFDATGVAGGFPFRWNESYGARIGIMPLGGQASEIRWVEIPPCYVFHELNAFRDGDDVVVDVCRHTRAQDKRIEDGRLTTPPTRLHRWRIDTSGVDLRFTDEIVEDRALEFPMHDRRFTGRRNRYGWFVEAGDREDTVNFEGIVFRDYQTGQVREWHPGVNGHAGEALFVPAAEGEGEGWLLSLIYDHGTGQSRMVVLDPMRIDRGPVATIHMPRRIPYGFHGTWVPSDLVDA